MLEHKNITIENINRILEFLPYFESTDNKFFKIDTTDLMYPYLYDKKVLDFEKALYDENIVYSFDWAEWQSEAEKYFNNPELLKTTDIETIRKLLTLHVRKERFCSGHFASMISSGHIINILKRLKEFRSKIKSK